MTTHFPLSGPLTVGDLLDRAFRLYRARFGQFLLTAAVFYIPSAVIAVLFTGAFTTGSLGGTAGQSLLNTLQSLTFAAFASLALTVQIIEALHGRPLSVGEGIRRCLGFYWPYLIILAITMGPFYLLSIGIELLIPKLVEINGTNGDVSAYEAGVLIVFLCAIPLFLLLAASLFYLLLRWFVSYVVLIAEERGPLDSLRRSWRLSRKNVLRILGYFVLLSIIAALFNIAPVFLLDQILPTLLPTSVREIGEGFVAATPSLLAVIYVPFYTGASVLLYYDLRIRNERYDLELRLAEMEEQVARDAGQDAP